jgi:hypothetical protein
MRASRTSVFTYEILTTRNHGADSQPFQRLLERPSTEPKSAERATLSEWRKARSKGARGVGIALGATAAT